MDAAGQADSRVDAAIKTGVDIGAALGAQTPKLVMRRDALGDRRHGDLPLQ
jgi:hypothetical protein